LLAVSRGGVQLLSETAQRDMVSQDAL